MLLVYILIGEDGDDNEYNDGMYFTDVVNDADGNDDDMYYIDVDNAADDTL